MFEYIPAPYPKGFCLTFENGVTASVRWGEDNCCSNRENNDTSPDAEVACWRKGDNRGFAFIHQVWKEADICNNCGYLSADQVVDFLAACKSYQPGTRVRVTRVK